MTGYGIHVANNGVAELVAVARQAEAAAGCHAVIVTLLASSEEDTDQTLASLGGLARP